MGLHRLHALRLGNVSTQRKFCHRYTSTMTSGSNGSTQWKDILFAQQSDRREVPATEAEFFNYTAKRWLYNEEYQLSQRRVQFSIPDLFDVAVKAAGGGAARCIQAMKYREGQYNKTLRLTLDNKAQVVVKIPNPNAGPAHFTTASEVATMDFIRNELGIPVPKVLAWNASTASMVGAEYIIMEPARGCLLSDVWYQLDKAAKYSIISQVIKLQATLVAESFPAIGSLYYIDDVVLNGTFPPWASSGVNKRFAVGPTVSSELWEAGPGMLTHKGPWRNLTDYALDLGCNELASLKSNPESRMNYFRQEEEQSGETRMLVEAYLAIAPLITQSSNDMSPITSMHSLSHPDLNLSNIFIDPQTKKITDIIDWQGSCTSPLLLQAKLPRMVQHVEPLELGLFMPEKAELRAGADQKARETADKIHQSALCQKYYEIQLAKNVPSLYSALVHNVTYQLPLIEPLEVVLRAWKNRTVFKLRASLIKIVEHWHDIFPTGPGCPIAFDEQSIRKHDEELENLDYIQSIIEAFEQAGILPADGLVDPVDYYILQEVNADQKQKFLTLAEGKEEREIMDKTWPWQDWPERARSEKTGEYQSQR